MPDCSIPPVNLLKVTSASPEKIPYGIRMLGAELEWPEVKEALRKIKVGVLDTGKPNHPDLAVAAAANFTNSADVYDHNGHGSHTAGTIVANGVIVGGAPWVRLYIYKVLNDQGSGQWAWLAQAIYQATNDGCNVINISLGGPSGNRELARAVNYAYNKGVKLVAAAGNVGVQGVVYPAAYSEVIATAAVDIEEKHPGWSSIGPAVEVAAAGVDVRSTWLNGQYAILSGTSMASPHIAAAVAILDAKSLVRRGRPLTPAEARLVLGIYAEDVGAFGKDPLFGFGVFSFGRLKNSDTVRRDLYGAGKLLRVT